MRYLREHWNGQLSPFKAYLINAALIGFLLQQKMPWFALTELVYLQCGQFGFNQDLCMGRLYFLFPAVWFFLIIGHNIWAIVGTFRTPISSKTWNILGKIYSAFLIIWLFRNIIVYWSYPQILFRGY